MDENKTALTESLIIWVSFFSSAETMEAFSLTCLQVVGGGGISENNLPARRKWGKFEPRVVSLTTTVVGNIVVTEISFSCGCYSVSPPVIRHGARRGAASWLTKKKFTLKSYKDNNLLQFPRHVQRANLINYELFEECRLFGSIVDTK